MKRTRHIGTAGCTVSAMALAAMMLLPDPDHLFRERHFFMTKTAGADEAKKAVRDSTTPPARNPQAAVEEEFEMARQQGTAAALELFIARHPDNPLAEKARAALRRLPR